MSRSRLRLEAVARGNRSLYPASPCVSICTLDDDNVCLGCSRTLEEITHWSSFTRERQWQVIDELRRRTDPDTVD